MSYGLINLQGKLEDSGMQGLRQAAQTEQQREADEKELEQAEKAGMMKSVGTGAAVGAMVGGPVGAVVGAGAGLLTYSFL